MKHHEVYQNGEDNGWLHKQNWWFDPNHEYGFSIGDLDSLYPEKYFEVDHVKPETIRYYCDHVINFFDKINGVPPSDIVEFGCAGGWFTQAFREMGIKVFPFEGSHSGIEASFAKTGSYPILHDFRFPAPIARKFEIALCTEVAEHIEPPFSATLVKSLCDASDLVWFSFEPPNTNPAHIHHCNEMPAQFWINLFEFYGYGCYMLPDWVFDQTEGRGRMIFYNKQVYGDNQFFQAH